MANITFRDLRADEIDCRIATVNEKGMTLLLYKDARCDMIILDETVGPFNWQRTHTRENANCIVSIWDEGKKQWISKEDTGTESNTEKEKGLASDSFKRACFNWGIGRELYTAPFIWISADKFTGKYDKFSVKEITINDKKITALTIFNITTKKVVYTFGKTESQITTEPAAANQEPVKSKPVRKTQPKEEPTRSKARQELKDFCINNNIDQNMIIKDCGLNKDSTDQDYENALAYAVRKSMDNSGLPFEV